MTKPAAFLRYIFFCMFFTIGAGSIALSFLAPELSENIRNIDQLEQTLQNNEKLEELLEIYDRQIEITKSDPDILKRLERKTLGKDPTEQDTAFPVPSQKRLELARQAINENAKIQAPPSKLRKYIEHSAKPKTRKGLFYAGAALILIAFIFFGTPKQKLEAPAQG